MIILRPALFCGIIVAILDKTMSDHQSDESLNPRNGNNRSLSNTIAGERLTLDNLYGKCGGKDWYKDDNTDHCDWKYIQCNDDGHIINLVLEQQLMSGIIPTELGTLTNLRTIDLSSNNLNGEIPSELGSLTEMVDLNLSYNQLTGDAPMELFDLPLNVLDLSFNKIKFVPSSIKFWDRILSTNIPKLKFSGNKIKEKLIIPSQYTSDSSQTLQELHLGENLLTGSLPPLLYSILPLLEVLDLSSKDGTNTGFSGKIPATYANFGNMKKLNLAGHNLSGTIPRILGVGGNLPDILMLDLSSNRLTGKIPFELASIGSNNNIDNDITINVAKNDFEKNNLAPHSLCTMKNFDLRNEKFCPQERDYLKEFFYLSKGQEWLKNDNWDSEYTRPCLDDWFGITCNSQKTAVTKIELPNNDISGKLSASIGKLESLKILNLSDNNMMGRIPSKIKGLSKLKELDLSYNNFKGDIPDEFEDITKNLDSMRLQGNRLTGAIIGLLKAGEITTKNEKKISKFVVDCGYPTDLGSPITCQNCTMCCNSNGECEARYNEDNKVATFFYAQLKEYPTLRFFMILTSILGICVIFSVISLCTIYLEKQNKDDNDQQSDNNQCLPRSSRQPKINDQWTLDQQFRTLLGVRTAIEPNLENVINDDNIATWMGKDSIYVLLLGKKKIGWLFAFLIGSAQMLVFWIFYKESMLDFEREDYYDQAWVYKWSCPRDGSTCEKEKFVSWSGWLVFSILMILNLVPDFWNGVKVLYFVPKRKLTAEDEEDSTIFGRFMGGFLLVSTAFIALYVSIAFNFANAGSNTELIINSAILLFVNNLDELSLKLIQIFFPTWMMMKEEEDHHDKVAKEKIEILERNIINNEEVARRELEAAKNEILQVMKSIQNNEIESLRNEIRQLQKK